MFTIVQRSRRTLGLAPILALVLCYSLTAPKQAEAQVRRQRPTPSRPVQSNNSGFGGTNRGPSGGFGGTGHGNNTGVGGFGHGNNTGTGGFGGNNTGFGGTGGNIKTNSGGFGGSNTNPGGTFGGGNSIGGRGGNPNLGTGGNPNLGRGGNPNFGGTGGGFQQPNPNSGFKQYPRPLNPGRAGGTLRPAPANSGFGVQRPRK